MVSAVAKRRGKGYGYVRVSSDPKGDKLSSKVQKGRIEAACKAKNIKHKKHYEDIDVSGRLFSRPGLDEMLATVEDGDTIICVESSRIGRSLYDTLTIIKNLDERGVRLWCLDNDFDTSTDAGRLAFQIMLSIYEFESRQIARRVGASRAESRKLGRWQGGSIPLGYKASKERGRIEISKKEAEAVQLIFDLRASGLSYPAISDELEKKGIRGKRGARIQATSVNLILGNLTYIGVGRWGDEEYEFDPECVPPIIDRGLWKRVREVDAAASITAPPRRGLYLCSGILTCDLCGSPMVRRIRHKESGTQIKKKGKKTVSAVDYYCFSAHSPREARRRNLKKCSGVMIRELMIEEHLTKALLEHVNDEFIKAEVEKLESPPEEKGEPEISKLRRRLGQMRVKQGRLVDLYMDEKIDKKVLDERSESLTAVIEDLESQIRIIENGYVLKRMAIESIASFESLEEEWPHLNIEERRALMALFVDEVRVSKGKGTDRVAIKWAD